MPLAPRRRLHPSLVVSLVACLPAMGEGPFFEGRQDLAVGVQPWAEIDPGTGGHLDRSPFSVGLGDVDGDGDVDAVAAAQASTFLSIFLNDGEGAMGPVPVDATGIGNLPRALRLASLNGDARADVVAVFQGDNQVGICLAQGAPPFYPAGSFAKLPTQQVPTAVHLSDLNGDGTLDIAVANRGASTISLYQGAAGGTFTARGAFSTGGVGAEPVDVNALDADGDGDRDLVAANQGAGTVVLLANGGAFAFGAPAAVGTVPLASRVWAGRLDGDAIDDLAVASLAGTVAPLLGTGSGSFTPSAPITVATSCSWVEGADMDADGDTDLVVAAEADGELVIVHQTAASPLAFGAGLVAPVGRLPQQAAVRDVDADGAPDVAVANAGSHAVSLLLNPGDGRPGAAGAVSTVGAAGQGGRGPEDVAPGERNGSPGPEIVTANRVSADTSVLYNDGFGTLLAPGQPGGSGSTLPAASGAAVVLARDLDGDGLVEVITAGGDGAAGRVKVVKGAGGEVNPALPPSVVVVDLALARVDADALTDLLVLDRGQASTSTAGHLYVLLGTSTPSLFGAVVTVPLPGVTGTSEPIAMAVADLTGDTVADVAVLYRNHASPTPDVAILVNSAGSLVAGPAPTLYAIGQATGPNMPEPKPSSIAAGDGDGDGDADLAVADPTQNLVTVLRNAGNATFVAAGLLEPRHAFCQRVLWADVDGDLREDVVAANPQDGNVSVLRATGGLAFAAAQAAGAGLGALGAEAWDREGDGDADLVVACPGADEIRVLENRLRGLRVLLAGPGPSAANPGVVAPWRLDGVALPAIAFTAYQTPSPSGTNVAATNLDGDASGVDEIVTGPGPGPQAPPLVRTWRANGTPLGADVAAYGGGGFGVNVSGAELDLDATGEIVTGPGPGTVYGPHVRGWQYTGSLGAMGKVNFYAYGTLQFGAGVSAGRLDADAFDEILTGAGPGAVFGPHVRGWNFDNVAVTAIAKVSFFAYSTLKFGVNARGGDVDGDGFGEILTGPGPGNVFGAVMRGFDYDQAPVASIGRINANVFPQWRYGVNVAAADVEGDGYAEIVAGAGDDPAATSRVQGFDYDDDRLQPMAALAVDTHPGLSYGVNVALADLGRLGR